MKNATPTKTLTRINITPTSKECLRLIRGTDDGIIIKIFNKGLKTIHRCLIEKYLQINIQSTSSFVDHNYMQKPCLEISNST